MIKKAIDFANNAYAGLKYFLYSFLIVIIIGFCVPENFKMPVKGATRESYNQKSFWYYPWGVSGTHKGVDIFAKEGTAVVSSTPGIVVTCGKIPMGGNIILVLGPKWRLHYFAHLRSFNVGLFSFLKSGEIIGAVGTTGNAKGKPPHLHYAIATLIPYPWRIDKAPQGWRKMFYLNPIEKLNNVR